MFTVKRRAFFAVLIFSLLLIGGRGSTFDNGSTHPELTRATAEFYNRHHPSRRLSPKQMDWLARGSVEEDDPVIRCRNHYYDPSTGRGLHDGKYEYLPTVPSPRWATSSRLQSRVWELGDHSWRQAIYNYQQENYEEAFISLGHVLHLLQDMGVPAHVRNDAHEEGDPWEKWLADNSHDIDIAPEAAEERFCSDIGHCFRELSSYTHNNFFSKDTIEERRDVELKGRYLYLDDIRLAYYNERTERIGLDEKVHQSYWDHLSPKVVGYGSGLIDLFFREAEGGRVEEPKSAWEYRWEEVKNKAEEVTERIGDGWEKGVSRVADAFKVDEDTPEEGSEIEPLKKEEKVREGRVLSARSEQKRENGETEKGDGEAEITEEGGKDEKKEDEKKEDEKKEDEKKEDEKREKAEKNEEEGAGEGDGEGREIEAVKREERAEKKKEKEKEEELGVARVVDGDTIVLEDGREVRYIGIDAPELGEEGSGDDEYLAWQARARNMELLRGEELELVKDPNKNKDKYGRLLRYVYIDGEFVNRILAREGMVEAFFCRAGWENCDVAADERRKEEIRTAARMAQEKGSGVHEKKRKLAQREETATKEKEEKEKRAKEKKIEKKTEEKTEKKTEKEERNKGNRETGRKREKESGGGQKKDPSAGDPGLPLHIRSGGSGGGDQEKEEERDSSKASEEKNEEKEGKDKSDRNKDKKDPPEQPEEEEEEESISDGQDGGGGDEGTSTSVFAASITSFEISDPENGASDHSASTTVAVDMEVGTTSPAMSTSTWQYHISSATTAPATSASAWSDTIPEEFTFPDDKQGERTVHAYLMEEGELSTSSASSTILVDTEAPTSSVTRLEDLEDPPGLSVSWEGEDADPASGIEDFDIQYYMEDGTGPEEWDMLAAATTSTGTRIRYATTSEAELRFRVRATDRAGNRGEWSAIASTSVNVDDQADHVVLSEIHPADYMDDQDFTNYWVELYNPTGEEVDMGEAGYRVERSTGSTYSFMEIGNSDHGEFPGGTVIPSEEHYLVVEEGASSELKERADAIINGSRDFALTEHNTVSLAAGHVSDGEDENIVDLVGYGNEAPFYEGAEPAPSPSVSEGEFLERKARATSTASLLAGGGHEDKGNGYDTDDNGNDLVVQDQTALISEGPPEEASTSEEGLVVEASSTAALVAGIEQQHKEDEGEGSVVVIPDPAESTTSTTTGALAAEGASIINMDTGKVVNEEGEETDTTLSDIDHPLAPTQSFVVDKKELAEEVTEIELIPSEVTPSRIKVDAGQAVALAVTAGGEETEILRFESEELRAVATGVSPGKTRVIPFNVPQEPGEYIYYSDMSGREEEGVMVVE